MGKATREWRTLDDGEIISCRSACRSVLTREAGEAYEALDPVKMTIKVTIEVTTQLTTKMTTRHPGDGLCLRSGKLTLRELKPTTCRHVPGREWPLLAEPRPARSNAGRDGGGGHGEVCGEVRFAPGLHAAGSAINLIGDQALLHYYYRTTPGQHPEQTGGCTYRPSSSLIDG